mmetsp:Transcript_20210/g.35925  ORF Transcript_20210/g.35925 Transcript_20210/m.35925 type:complete len:134 (+) Transcript_20210:174-575(+)|eukprot:CAMPEP_0184537974 /NCGR_PEP_ID=MMETSP0198_2-20121128/17350_1 /TAXON_ID=1112570 /ORGANISM="Thraustochytrium sp., Strain LLF1b" /LENGTH=133 /DNA_ID=CAMNT_0026931401 /DNA_START=142 /DNA_END=543 /DNA_ORIENTATION=+
MYDFCLTIPYGALLLVGGLMGLANGSIASALSGGVIGALLVALGWYSWQEWKENANATDKRFRSPTYAYVVVAAVLTLIVTFMMGERYMETEAMFPAGYVTIISAGMLVFYCYKLMFSGDVGSSAERAYKRND